MRATEPSELPRRSADDPAALDADPLSPHEQSTWRGSIPVATVDLLLPLFGATMPADLLPERRGDPGFCEPVLGVAMREMFETQVFRSLFGPGASPDTLAFTHRRDTDPKKPK